MALPDGVSPWFLFALALGLAVALAGGVGALYGRVARRWNDDRAARGTNAIAVGAALCAAIPVWAFVDAAASLEVGVVPAWLAGGVLASVAGGLAAGGVGTAAIVGITRNRPDLPGVSDPSRVYRHYARYLIGLFTVILLVISAAAPTLRSGTLAVGAVLAALVIVLWVGAPFLATLTASTRSPTADERARFDELLAASGLSVRGVRVIEGDDRYVSVEVSGAPGARFLFVSRGALETFTDETLTALLTTRREQAAHYETTIGVVALLAPLLVVVAIVDGVVPLSVGLAAIGLAGGGGLALTRRLRYHTDARAAERVGAEELADAFERACEAAGFDLEDDGGGRWLSTTPSIASRIERLREGDSAGGGRSG